jgi:hypothetical protein
MKKTAVPDRIKRRGKIESSKNRAKSRFRGMKATNNRVRERRDLIKSRARGTKTRLRGRKNIRGFSKIRTAKKDKLFKKTRETRGERDGAIRRRKGGVFVRFENRKNMRNTPGGRKRGGRPTKIKNMENKMKRFRRKMTKHRKRDEIRARGSGGRERGKTAMKIRKRKGRTKRRGRRGTGTDCAPSQLVIGFVPGPVRLRYRARKNRRIVRAEGRRFTRGRGGTRNTTVRGNKRGRTTRERTNKGKNRFRVKTSVERGRFGLPSPVLSHSHRRLGLFVGRQIGSPIRGRAMGLAVKTAPHRNLLPNLRSPPGLLMPTLPGGLRNRGPSSSKDDV